jgi:mannose-6-phosphate isomerase
LSLQVHPPAAKAAAKLNGEPKTEMWFIADAAPDASLYVGLKRGVTRAEFEKKIADGSVADCFHRIPVQGGRHDVSAQRPRSRHRRRPGDF